MALDYLCGPPLLPPPSPLPSSLFLFPLLFLLLRSSPNGLCTTPRTWWHHPWNRSASAVCTCSVVLIPCLSPSLLSPSLPLSLPPPSSFFLSFFHTLFFPLHPCPLSCSALPLTHPPSSSSSSPFSFLWLCFFPSGVQMTLLVIAVKPTLWPVSTVCQLPLLSLLSDLSTSRPACLACRV